MTAAAPGTTTVTIRLLRSNRALYRLSIGLKPTLLSGRLSKAIDGARTRFITHSENGLITEEIGYRLEYGRWLLEDPKVSAGMFQTDDREKRVAVGKALLLS